MRSEIRQAHFICECHSQFYFNMLLSIYSKCNICWLHKRIMRKRSRRVCAQMTKAKHTHTQSKWASFLQLTIKIAIVIVAMRSLVGCGKIQHFFLFVCSFCSGMLHISATNWMEAVEHIADTWASGANFWEIKEFSLDSQQFCVDWLLLILPLLKIYLFGFVCLILSSTRRWKFVKIFSIGFLFISKQ